MPGKSMTFEGRALVGEELEIRDVLIEVRNGIIHRIEEIHIENELWICPAHFNAHTHIGDAIAMDIPAKGSLEELVTPPFGLKHRLLSDTKKEHLIHAMRATLGAMSNSGQAGFADFREGGIDGVDALRHAVLGIPTIPVVFGRDGGEAVADGIGISSSRDVADIESRIRQVRQRGGLVAFHAGERDSSDIDPALEYEPDLLIHCTYATPGQLARIAEMEIPIAVCARSNWKLGVSSSRIHPPFEEMQKKGCRILLGTDNVMFVQPDMWREMEFIANVYRLDPVDLLRYAIDGAGIVNRSFYVEEGNPANFLVLDTGASNLHLSRDMHGTLVNRAGQASIVNKVFNS
jgi:cytosine/adenosine deaminase-related metal-dependent hydrolase